MDPGLVLNVVPDLLENRQLVELVKAVLVHLIHIVDELPLLHLQRVLMLQNLSLLKGDLLLLLTDLLLLQSQTVQVPLDGLLLL